MINRKIYELIGHWALSQQVDTWQYVVSTRANIEVKRDDMVFIHNREQDYISDVDRKEVLERTAEVWASLDKKITDDANKVRKYLRKNRVPY